MKDLDQSPTHHNQLNLPMTSNYQQMDDSQAQSPSNNGAHDISTIYPYPPPRIHSTDQLNSSSPQQNRKYTDNNNENSDSSSIQNHDPVALWNTTNDEQAINCSDKYSNDDNENGHQLYHDVQTDKHEYQFENKNHDDENEYKEHGDLPTDKRKCQSDQKIKPDCDDNNHKIGNRNRKKHLSSKKLQNLRCGYFAYRPDWLQTFNSPKYYLFLLSISILLTHMQAHGIKATIVPSIEKRYNMSSTYLGSIMSVNDAIGGVCGPLLTFLVAQRLKNKWIGWSIAITGVGYIIFALPHIMTPPYYYSRSQVTNSLCHSNHNSTPTVTTCTSTDQTSHWVYTFLFIIGQSVIGCGLTIQYCLGVTYIDENVKPNVSPLFIAIINMMSVIGTSAGLLLGGIINNVYVNWPNAITDLLPSDIRWIGAWWLSYIATGILLILLAPIFFAFPHQLSTYTESKRARMRCQSAENCNNDQSYNITIGQLIAVTRQLVCNSLFILPVVGLTLEKITIGGLVTFLPKYIQSQTGLSLFLSSITGGGAVILGSSIGQFLGGYLIKRWKLQGSNISKFCVYACFLNLLFSGVLLMNCGNRQVIGIDIHNRSMAQSFHTANISTAKSHLPTCKSSLHNTNCYCKDVPFSPVCGSDGKVYASPCIAGCTTKIANKQNQLIFTNCSCIEKKFNKTATNGYCRKDCDVLYPLFIGIFISSLTSFIVISPTITVILRNIPENQRAYGIALRGFFTKIFGNIIGTIAIGSIIDHSCTLWNNSCSDSNFCWKYDNVSMSLYLFACVAILKLLKFVIYMLLWRIHSKEEKLAAKQDNKESPLTPSISSVMNHEFGTTVQVGNTYLTAF